MKIEDYSRILVIQTAYIGDVILMTPLLEKLKQVAPHAQVDVLINQNNSEVLQNNPHIHEQLLWNKRERKNRNLARLIRTIRRKGYQLVLNCHRYASSGIITNLSGAHFKVGFNTNPLSRWYNIRVPHSFSAGKHEVDRNLDLLKSVVPELMIDDSARRPRIYPSPNDQKAVELHQEAPYVCIAPTSVWFTKQFPAARWIQLLKSLAFDGNYYLLGGPADRTACELIKAESGLSRVHNLAGELSLLQSAYLMKGAVLNYVNDSAPLHLASAMNAPVCAVFCSTVPRFGFTPLSDFSEVIDIGEPLACRPCGLHGYPSCPEAHFRCALDIDNSRLVRVFERAYCPG